MKNITDIELLKQMKAEAAVFILFGGPHCAVCQSLRPRLSSILEQQFPHINAVYVNCEKSADICAQHSVFSLPVVKAYIEGMQVAEEAGSFSIKQLMQSLERPYSMWQDSINNN